MHCGLAWLVLGGLLSRSCPLKVGFSCSIPVGEVERGRTVAGLV